MCIAAIACLSKQESARTGNALGLIGVTGGVAATLGGMHADAGTYAQVGTGWLKQGVGGFESLGPQGVGVQGTQGNLKPKRWPPSPEP